MEKVLTILIIGLVVRMTDCKNRDLNPALTPSQQRAQSLTGTWAEAHNIQVPPGVGNDIIENLSMTFFTDMNLNQAGFSTSGAPLIIESESKATSEFNSGNKDNILLFDVSPVNSFVIVNFDPVNMTMTINFYHPGLNNYAHKGGDYVVTLVKQ